MRARHSHLRDRDAQHARLERGAAAQGMDASAGAGRSEPRHRNLQDGGADGSGSNRSGRRWPTDRSASEAGERALGRPPAAKAVALRRPDEDAEAASGGSGQNAVALPLEGGQLDFIRFPFPLGKGLGVGLSAATDTLMTSSRKITSGQKVHPDKLAFAKRLRREK